ncbi:sugar kinase [Streptomyces sp. NPDC005574]|uniref:sugar kinase n=1 Tax=Streptomyces sp. NPDC005574 TaxID=3156891 RepID=UPI0033B5169E
MTGRHGAEVIALGEVMLRFDPGEGRIRTARSFQVWEGGGEYNVVRGLRRCFGMRTAVVTALADNPVGRLVEDLMLQGGVDTSLVRWAPADGIGRTARNGLNFVERGFGIRGALGVSDRANTAVSQLRKGDVDFDAVFADGPRWFHTGGIFAGLSDTTVDVADEAMATARRHGVTVSYDPNHRPSLWDGRGGADRAREVDLRLARHADVVVGALGLAGKRPGAALLRADEVPDALAGVAGLVPGAKVLATTLREVPSAGVNNWSSAAWSAPTGYLRGPEMPGLHVLDRIGSGDGFAAGLIYGLLTGDSDEHSPSAGADPALSVEGARLRRALAYGTAHGALTMTTPGDVSMASLSEVEALMAGGSAAVRR